MALLILPDAGDVHQKRPIASAATGPSLGVKIPPLQADQSHLWSVDLDQPVPRAETLLSADELDKAGRYKFAVHRERFIHGRALLRLMLAHYTGEAPEKLRLNYGPAGKPAIAHGPSFNVAHSGAVALFAFAQDGQLGVDVERIHSLPEMAGVAKIFFSNSEYESWKSLPAEEQELAFFQCWTRKEAFVKAIGDGISELLKDFVVAFEPGTECALLELNGKYGAKSAWKLQSFEPAIGYLGALAISNPHATTNAWRLELSSTSATTLA
jgi:4'-phosphopantetheinyl transferase